jgi:hypothetical protein
VCLGKRRFPVPNRLMAAIDTQPVQAALTSRNDGPIK